MEKLTLYPIEHQDVFEFYKKAVASFWTVEEVDLTNDLTDFAKLTENERGFIKMVLAFFAASDTIVNENLALNMYNKVDSMEAKCFYGFQIAMENIHSEMYSLLIDTYVKNPQEKTQLFQSAQTVPGIRKKQEWAFRWVEDSTLTYADRLVAFACVEGIFFSSSFCAIFWLKKRGLMHGLGFSNELISRDEGLHCDFACLMYNKLDVEDKLSEDRVHAIVKDAVEAEQNFVDEALPVAVIGMNATWMKQYVEFCADRLVQSLGYAAVYGSTNPFDWMDMISMQGKTNFFERRVGEYAKANVLSEPIKLDLNFDAMDVDF